MRIGFIAGIVVLCSFSCFSQKDTIYVTLQAPSIITEEKQFVFGVSFKTYYQNQIQIAVQPIYADNGADFGDVKFALQKLSSGGCYETIVVDSDPLGIDLNNYIKNISYGDSLSYEYDVRNIYYMRKGVYRIKAYLVFSKNKKPRKAGSEWVYFEVKTDRFSKLKSS
jgi:hypothetical protein